MIHKNFIEKNEFLSIYLKSITRFFAIYTNPLEFMICKFCHIFGFMISMKPLEKSISIQEQSVYYKVIVQVPSCLRSNDILENVLEQELQQYLFTSECVCKCARKFERSANARRQ